MQVTVYESESGDQPVENFIKSLDLPTRVKVARHIRLLSENGHLLRMPYSKFIADGLYELRTRGKTEVRIFYCFDKSNKAILLHAIQKKSNAIPKKDLRTALERLAEVK